LTNQLKGIREENNIADMIRDKTPFDVEQSHIRGIDILIKTPDKDIKVEVKSASYKVRNGKKGYRSGKFSFYRKNLGKFDFVAFVVKYSKNMTHTYWCPKEKVIEYFKETNAKDKCTLSIPRMLKFGEESLLVDFSEVIKCD